MTTTITGATGVNQITDDAITVAKLPAGAVLQVVYGNTNTSTQSTSSTYADTGLTATITPTSASSKILVLVSQNGLRKESANTYVGVRLHRGSSSIGQITLSAGYNEVSQTASDACSWSVLDTPSTTSATTYKTVFNNGESSGTVSIQVNSVYSTITLMEIAQ
tara:strand:- start:170 stop:658 length:489 start_codon:yes stop_codon:yes gene_type:complete